METAQNISSLTLDVTPISPQDTVSDVAEKFLAKKYSQFLSLPVVDGTTPVGIISRYGLMNIFIRLYGRELYGKRPIRELMNPRPLVIEIDETLTRASQQITENIQFPVTEDYIVVQNGAYRGLGVVVNLLKAMEHQVARHSDDLSKAYQQLQSSQSQLVQSEKMASLGQMVAGVAHEINTPLGYVRNNVDLVKAVFNDLRKLTGAYAELSQALVSDSISEDQLCEIMARVETLVRELNPADQIKDIETILEDTIYGTEQISELVINLKNFSRLDQAKLTDININECLESVLVVGRNAIKYKADVIKQFGDIPKISCSPSQINQVFLNLVTNAAQAIEEHGQIVIKTLADEQNVYVVIEDNGKGITEEVLPKIFDPFFTTKEIGQGTGLGLAISYQIIDQHDGKITVSSKPGEGSRFTVVLPQQSIAFQKTG
ncbi:MAG TPA: CBS domain-containing protein [Acidiferrobacteraceae bacterium]|nr:CBS domain-containing protein [Acidiferrobacteraceae bacterium]